MKYLYILKDGDLRQSDEAPTPEDLKLLDEGSLSSVLIFDGEMILEQCLSNSIEPVEEASLCPNNNYHY